MPNYYTVQATADWVFSDWYDVYADSREEAEAKVYRVIRCQGDDEDVFLSDTTCIQLTDVEIQDVYLS